MATKHAYAATHAQEPLAPARARELHGALLGWYEQVRRDLPWRRTQDPYAVWLSEIMLQQTRVETVVPYFERFMNELPTVQALAEAPADRVMSLWSGLGYYRRARMLHEAAQQIVREKAGAFPADAAGLLEVRGIGRYTAGAIASIAYGERAALVDGNVARVLARLFAVEEDVRGGPGLKRIWELADALVPEERAGDWNQALMELGATTCIPRAPRCLVCPVREACEARRHGIEGELPKLKAKAKPKEAAQVALVATRKGAVVLARRKRGGLFGGLWEPPTVPGVMTDEEACEAFAVLLGVGLRAPRVAGVVTHVLSHRRLETRVLSATLARAPRPRLPRGGLYDAVEMVEPSAFAGLGMSTLARKVLGRAGGG
jgi:A/G-specific adenine glycosylase